MKSIFTLAVAILMCSCISMRTITRANNELLLKVESFLNLNVPQYKEAAGFGFNHMIDGTTVGYRITDLTDTTNINKLLPEDGKHPIKFIEGHFYHIYPSSYFISYSSIFYFDGNDFTIFRFVNCPNQGVSIADVLSFASKKIKDSPAKAQVLKDIEAYRKYGEYIYDDYGSPLNCD